MNKEQFLRRLKRLLHPLPEEERERLLQYYREILEDKIEEGVPEQEAVGGLGDPRVLAGKILSENPARRRMSGGKIAAVAVVSILGVFVVAGAALAALGYTSQKPAASVSSVTAAETKQYAVGAKGIFSVRVDAENKEIDVEPSASGRITVDYCPAADQQYSFSCESGTLTVTSRDRSGGKKFADFFYRKVPDPAGRITLRVPGDFSGSLALNTQNGAISAENLKKLTEFSCDDSNSAIRVSGCTVKSLQVQSTNAAISFSKVSASEKLSATTENAVISLDGISAPEIALKTTNAMISGMILGREEDYSIDSHTVNGVNNLKSRAGGPKRLTVKTVNAVINIRFQAD